MGNNISCTEKTDDIKINQDCFKKKYIIVYDHETYILKIRIIDNGIYLYTKNVSHDNFILSYFTQSDISSKLKYIQISPNFKYISIPEENQINLYDLKSMICDNNMSYVKTLCQIDENNIYKCILTDDIFIRTSINETIISINGVEWKENNKFKLDIKINNNTIIKFSANCRTVLKYVDNFIVDIYKINNKYEIEKSEINLIPNKNDNKLSFINLSDDGNIIIYSSISKNKTSFFIYNIQNKYTQQISIQLDNKLCNVISCINLIDIDIWKRFNNFWLVINWSTDYKIQYWLIGSLNISQQKYIQYGPFNLDDMYSDMNDIIYFYANQNIIICMTKMNKVKIIDMYKVASVNIIDIILNELKNELLKHPNNYTDRPNKIKITASDDSIIEYKINNDLRFLMTSDIKYDTENNIHKIDTKVNTNIDILDCGKSLNIFQNMISTNDTQGKIINRIIKIESKINQINMMSEIMDHFYEYIRCLIIGENTKIDLLDHNHHRNLRVLFIAYLLLSFLLRYILVSSQYLKKKLLNGILNDFCFNFPIFNNVLLKMCI